MDGMIDPTASLDLERVFDVGRDAVFAAFLDPMVLRRIWSTARFNIVEMTIDARIGGGWNLAMRDETTGVVSHCQARYLDLVQPSRIVWQGRWLDGPYAGARETRVTLDFAEDGGRTRLRLKHELIADRKTRDHFVTAWAAEFARLDRVLASDTAD